MGLAIVQLSSMASEGGQSHFDREAKEAHGCRGACVIVELCNLRGTFTEARTSAARSPHETGMLGIAFTLLNTLTKLGT